MVFISDIFGVNCIQDRAKVILQICERAFHAVLTLADKQVYASGIMGLLKLFVVQVSLHSTLLTNIYIAVVSLKISSTRNS